MKLRTAQHRSQSTVVVVSMVALLGVLAAGVVMLSRLDAPEEPADATGGAFDASTPPRRLSPSAVRPAPPNRAPGLAALAEPEEPDRGGFEGLAGHPPCQEDGGCGPWERCVLGRCLDGRRDCAADPDCGDDARCELATCLPGARRCDARRVCDVGECVFGRCMDSPGECVEDADCGDQHRCVFGGCSAGRRDCALDQDCDDGLRCDFGRCSDRGPE